MDVLVHSQDIAVPLGRTHPMPIEPAAHPADPAAQEHRLFEDQVTQAPVAAHPRNQHRRPDQLRDPPPPRQVPQG
jgi:hypothetical protein